MRNTLSAEAPPLALSQISFGPGFYAAYKKQNVCATDSAMAEERDQKNVEEVMLRCGYCNPASETASLFNPFVKNSK